ncbi:MAG: hypothetical protein ABI612_06410 [Betaproteobacteria bacterium]
MLSTQKILQCVGRALLSCALAVAASTATATTLRAAVEGDTIVIYSSSEKAVGCRVSVMFSYKYGDGRRATRLECNGRAPAEQDFPFCKTEHAQYHDPKIERPIQGGCE